MNAHYSGQIILSPLLFAIHTLIAEFLYAHNCHFTLSVFVSETQFKTSMPSFERMAKFRFNNTELNDIGQAIGLKQPDAVCIFNEYDSNQQNGSISSSLLYSIFQVLLGGLYMPIPPSTGRLIPKKVPLLPPQKHKTAETQTTADGWKGRRRRESIIADEKHDKYLKKFNLVMDRMSEHVVKMTANMEALKSSVYRHSEFQQSYSDDKFDLLNESLVEINDKLQQLVRAETEPNQMTLMVTTMSWLTVEMQRCAESFDQLLQLSRNTACAACKSAAVEDGAEKPPLKYTEWVNKLRYSKYGQTFLRNIEEYQKKKLKQERFRLNQVFKVKLAESRLLIKLNVKQKILQKCRGIVNYGMLCNMLDVTDSEMKKINLGIDDKLRVIQRREEHIKSSSAELKNPSILTRVSGVSVNIVPATATVAKKVFVSTGPPLALSAKQINDQKVPLEKVPAATYEPMIVKQIVSKTQ